MEAFDVSAFNNTALFNISKYIENFDFDKTKTALLFDADIYNSLLDNRDILADTLSNKNITKELMDRQNLIHELFDKSLFEINALDSGYTEPSNKDKDRQNHLFIFHTIFLSAFLSDLDSFKNISGATNAINPNLVKDFFRNKLEMIYANNHLNHYKILQEYARLICTTDLLYRHLMAILEDDINKDT